jgi:hypothetical protein
MTASAQLFNPDQVVPLSILFFSGSVRETIETRGGRSYTAGWANNIFPGQIFIFYELSRP